MSDPDFYIGYLPRAPRILARFVTRVVFGVGIAAVLIGLILVFAQEPFAPARFEYAQTRTLEGTVALTPYPALLTAGTPYLLVGPGKHGITDEFSQIAGRRVRLQGSLVEGESGRMLEVIPGRVDVQPASGATGSDVALGPVTLKGEIVDTKCHFGVMNPGSGKVHRDCAVRCISGGIPPGLLVRDREGNLHTVLLAGPRGSELHKEILDFVAEPVRVQGALVRSAGFLVLQTSVTNITRLNGRE